MIEVVRIGEGFELRIEAGDAAAIFRRRRVFAGEIARVGRGRISRARFGQGELVFPAIAEVVDISQLRRAWPKQRLEGQLGGPAAADALSADGKFPQMRIFPCIAAWTTACSCLSVIATGTSISRQIGGSL